MTNSGKKLETGKKKIPNGFANAMLFFSSTYCKLEGVVSIFFLAYVVKSQQEVTSVGIIKMRKFYKDTLVKSRFTYGPSYGLLRTHKYPRCVSLWPADSDCLLVSAFSIVLCCKTSHIYPMMFTLNSDG